MATDDQQVLVTGTAPAPASWRVPGNGQIQPKSIFAHFNGSGAATAYKPAIKVVSDGGETVGIYPCPDQVAAGGSADVSWFPGFLDSGIKGATVATTVAGLGSVYDGKLGLLTDGAAAWIPLTYNAAAGAWVSPYRTGPQLAGQVTTTSAAYVRLGGTQTTTLGHVGSITDWWNAGLAPSVALAGNVQATTGGATASLRLAVYGFTDGDTSMTQMWASGTAVLSQVAPNAVWHNSAFDVMSAAPTKDQGELAFEANVTAGTGFFTTCVSIWRWVSR